MAPKNNMTGFRNSSTTLNKNNKRNQQDIHSRFEVQGRHAWRQHRSGHDYFKAFEMFNKYFHMLKL